MSKRRAAILSVVVEGRTQVLHQIDCGERCLAAVEHLENNLGIVVVVEVDYDQFEQAGRVCSTDWSMMYSGA